MLYLGGITGLLALGVWILCIIDVLRTPQVACRRLPKLAWLVIVVLLPTIGSIAWLVVGRPWDDVERAGTTARSGVVSRYPEYDRPNRAAATNPEDDELFLAQLRERARQQRQTEARRRGERETRRAEGDEAWRPSDGEPGSG